jgi:hypothetical protein
MVFRRRRRKPDFDDAALILQSLMRIEAKLDRIELLVQGEDPDE